jgi:hypothetical protein
MSHHICYLEIFGVHSSQQIQREVLASFQPFLTLPWLNCGESHWRSGVLINGFALTILVRCVRELRVGFQLVLVPMATPGRGLQIHSNRIHCKPSSYWGLYPPFAENPIYSGSWCWKTPLWTYGCRLPGLLSQQLLRPATIQRLHEDFEWKKWTQKNCIITFQNENKCMDLINQNGSKGDLDAQRNCKMLPWPPELEAAPVLYSHVSTNTEPEC